MEACHVATFTKEHTKDNASIPRSLRAAIQKFRLEVCKKEKKSKIPKLCLDIGLDELFLEKILEFD